MKKDLFYILCVIVLGILLVSCSNPNQKYSSLITVTKHGAVTATEFNELGENVDMVNYVGSLAKGYNTVDSLQPDLISNVYLIVTTEEFIDAVQHNAVDVIRRPDYYSSKVIIYTIK